MARKTRHPEREILELADGALAASSRQEVEAHLAECTNCAAVAAVVGALKRQAYSHGGPKTDLADGRSESPGPTAYGLTLPVPSADPARGSGQSTPHPVGHRDLEFKDLLQDANVSRPGLEPGLVSAHTRPEFIAQGNSAHLDAADLASFFYGELPREAAAAAAGHLAMCSECASIISLYYDSDAAAQAGEPASLTGPGMSEESWRLIREWEKNCLAYLRPESDAPSREMLERFIDILKDHREEIDRVADSQSFSHALGTSVAQIVPVVVLDSSGGFRGVEPFHRLSRPRGLEALQCQAPPDRFHNLPIHALLGAEREYPMVISSRINRGMAELDYGAVQASLMRPLGYFIVEN